MPISQKYKDIKPEEALHILKGEEVTKLLKLLMKEGITKALLMPTYEMIVKNLKMRRRLGVWWENQKIN